MAHSKRYKPKFLKVSITGDHTKVIKEENLILNKGFNLLPKPSECDLFFDLEGVQDYVFPGKLEYLFGVYYEENREKIFKPFWAHNKKEEKQTGEFVKKRKISRNEPCSCGSGKKYKHCHGKVA